MTDWVSSDGKVRVIQDDALSVLPTLDAASIDIIATDPPFMGVKDHDWDNQWVSASEYLVWIGKLCEQWRRVLKPNGSLYVFASPQMAARVELAVGEWFAVLTNIRWLKPPFSTKAEMFVKEDLRAYFPASEAIIFAEQYGSDETANGQAGYTTACEQTKRNVFGEYLESEIQRSGATHKEITLLFPSKTGGPTGWLFNKLSGIQCPTREQYDSIRAYLNNRNCGEYLRREYEDLRREYEDLRRPFSVSADVPFTDVWSFPTVGNYPGKHPCEKPLAMCSHIISASSRPGAVVLDCFAGSGVVGQACVALGRQAILIERDEHWATQCRRRAEGLNPQPCVPAAKAVNERERYPLFAQDD